MVWSCRLDDPKVTFDQQLLEQIEKKHNEQVESTLQKSKELCNAVDVSGSSLLNYAAEFGNEYITAHLIKSRSKINHQNKDGNTPLLLATKQQHVETIKILLESKANIYICDNEGVSALQLAVRMSPINLEIVKLFLRQLSNDCSYYATEIVKKLIEVNCPLYIAVLLKNVDVTMCMLSEHCAIDARDPMSGRTALHFAVENLDPCNVDRLLSFGADVNAEDLNGKLPLAMLQDFSQPNYALSILKTLINARTKISFDIKRFDYDNVFMQLRLILLNGTKECIELVLDTYLRNSQATDENKQNVIYYLALNCNHEIVEIIESRSDLENIDVNQRDINGSTALHCAMSVGNVNFVKYLIGKGANMNIMNNNGISCFMQAVDSKLESSLERRVECVKFLLMMNNAYPDIFMGHYFKIYDTKWTIDRDYLLLEPVIAILAIWKILEISFNHEILQKIYSHPKLNEYFDFCTNQLQTMKNLKFYKNVTLFSILIQDESFKSVQNSVFFKSTAAGDKIKECNEKYISISIYQEFLEQIVRSKNRSNKNYNELIIHRIKLTLWYIIQYIFSVFVEVLFGYAGTKVNIMFLITSIVLFIFGTGFFYVKTKKLFSP